MNPSELFSLKNRVAVVLGGTSGIGLAIAHRLVAEGAAVSICARKRDGLAAAVGALQDAGGTVVGAVADVTEPAHLERFVDDTADRIGRLDDTAIASGRDRQPVLVVPRRKASRPSVVAQLDLPTLERLRVRPAEHRK